MSPLPIPVLMLIYTKSFTFDFAYTKYEDDFSSYMHSHTASEIIYVVNGYGSLDTLQGSYPMTRGTILLINGNILHTEKQLSGKKPVEYYVVMLENIFFSNANTFSDREENRSDQVFRIDFLEEHFNRISELFNKMYGEMNASTSQCEKFTFAYLMNFLAILVRYTEINLQPSPKENNQYSSIVGYAKKYIDCYYNTAFKITDLAEKISVSYSHLCHKFKQELGLTPVEYKLAVQLDEAKAMLKNSDFRIGQICIQAGFNNFAYFTKMFRSRFGITPKEYRKQIH